MESSTLVVFVSQLAQAGGALVLALVLEGFHRLYQREYLRTWAWSWWAFCVWMVSAGLALALAQGDPGWNFARTFFTGIALVSGYWQIAWLLFGTYELATTRTVPQRAQVQVLGALFALAVAPL